MSNSINNLSWILGVSNGSFVTGMREAHNVAQVATTGISSAFDKLQGVSAPANLIQDLNKSAQKFQQFEKDARLNDMWKGWTNGTIPRSVKSGMGQIHQKQESLVASALMLVAAYKVIEGMKWGIELAAQSQRALLAMEQLAGSPEKARATFENIKSFALDNTLNPAPLIKATQLLMTMGITASDSLRITKAAAANAALSPQGFEQGLDSITRALGQMKAKGKASAEEITQQLGEAGVNGWEMIARKLGKTIPEVQKLAEKGILDSATAIIAITEGMERKSGDSLKRLAGTYDGIFTRLKSRVGQSLEGVFEKEDTKSGIAKAADGVAWVLERSIKGFDLAAEKLNDNVLLPLFGKYFGKETAEMRKAREELIRLQDEKNKASIQKTGFDMQGEAIGPQAMAYLELVKKMKQEMADFGKDDFARQIAELGRAGIDPKRLAEANQVADQLKKLQSQKGLMDEGARLAERLDPMIHYRKELDKLNELLKAGAISQQIHGVAAKKAAEDLTRAQDQLSGRVETLKEIESLTNSLTQSIDRLNKVDEVQQRINKLKNSGGAKPEEIAKLEAMKRQVDMAQKQSEESEKQKRIQDEVKSSLEGLLTPQERYAREWEKINRWKEEGRINDEEFNRLNEKAAADLASHRQQNSLPQAATLGTREAFNAAMGKTTDVSRQSLKELEKIAKSALEQSAILKKLLEKEEKNPKVAKIEGRK